MGRIWTYKRFTLIVDKIHWPHFTVIRHTGMTVHFPPLLSSPLPPLLSSPPLPFAPLCCNMQTPVSGKLRYQEHHARWFRSQPHARNPMSPWGCGRVHVTAGVCACSSFLPPRTSSTCHQAGQCHVCPGYGEVIKPHIVGSLTIPRASIKWV